jgi:hypothetical protein
MIVEQLEPKERTRIEKTSAVRSLFHEPLLHFLAAGLVLFGINAWYSHSKRASAAHRVTMTQAQVENLRQMWAVQWNRLPDQAETEQLINDAVREEILYREAIALGLDQGDTIVRRRLATKMDLLLGDAPDERSPTEGELRNYYAANRARYVEPPRMSFTHLYFSPEKRADPKKDASEMLGRLRANARVPQADAFPYGADYDSRDAEEIDRDFGPGFAAKILGCRIGAWEGPFESGFGDHLVLVRDRSEPEVLPFETVRDQVRKDFAEQARQEAHDRAYQTVSRRYSIEVEK